MILKNFIVFEGCDGAGTTTQADLLQKKLMGEKTPCYKTAEPTEGHIGKLLRRVLQDEFKLESSTIAYLFAADRCQHVYGSGGILERVQNGEVVICDRYVLSSFVYQGILCGDELPILLNKDFPAPEALLFLDIDNEIALNRVENRAQNDKSRKEIYEVLNFQRQARLMYQKHLPFCKEQGTKIKVIDASRSIGEIQTEINSFVEAFRVC